MHHITIPVHNHYDYGVQPVIGEALNRLYRHGALDSRVVDRGNERYPFVRIAFEAPEDFDIDFLRPDILSPK